ncbi:MAG TPA: TraB/GumN family protein [Myxococcota bacterium]|nr:TraB/GumN family protein [Myxococcota bacterium]
MRPIFSKQRFAWGVAVFAFFLATSAARASDSSRPLLWKIEGAKTSYLFGTIHVPDERVLKLNPSVRAALDGADAVFTELPMDMGTQMKIAMKSMLPEGKTLKDVLPKDLYAKIDKLFASKGLPMMMLGRFKIWAIAVQVTLLDHLMEFASKQPLDQYIYKQAGDAGKQVGGLETTAEQLAVFDSLSQKEQVKMLRDALDERDKYKAKGVDFIKVLIDIYLRGDEKELLNKITEEYDPTDPLDRKMMKLLFTDRNTRMTERIAAKLKASPEKSQFFAIGSGHLPGPEGIVSRLQKAGFKVTRIGR